LDRRIFYAEDERGRILDEETEKGIEGGTAAACLSFGEEGSTADVAFP
jgi:hypothetical protein